MNEPADSIWLDDRLGRRDEAQLIESFVLGEVERFARTGREQSFVLAIDAAYGEGKSWFLDHFARQLALNHPVARIDAWVDDANDEPLVAIMAAIEDALSVYLEKSEYLRKKFASASRAALPIIGKALAGAGSRLLSRYIGESFFEDAGEEIRKASQQAGEKRKSATEEAVEKASDNMADAINALIDREAEERIEAYRQRQVSRAIFRERMAALVASIDNSSTPGQAPLYVIVDELDRCRPNYAIRVLEEIKHFFEVPNVVFLIALHGDQLTKSIDAVYGVEFDSEAYLRRFFTRRYEMKRLPVHDIATLLYQTAGLQDDRFNCPPVVFDRGMQEISPVSFIGWALEDLSVTPREVFPVMDMVALFHDQWRSPAKIELVALLPMTVQIVRGQNPTAAVKSSGRLKLFVIDHGGRAGAATIADVAQAVVAMMGNELGKISQNGDTGVHGVAGTIFRSEMRARFPRGYVASEQKTSVITRYASILRLLDRFIDEPEPKVDLLQKSTCCAWSAPSRNLWSILH